MFKCFYFILSLIKKNIRVFCFVIFAIQKLVFLDTVFLLNNNFQACAKSRKSKINITANKEELLVKDAINRENKSIC